MSRSRLIGAKLLHLENVIAHTVGCELKTKNCCNYVGSFAVTGPQTATERATKTNHNLALPGVQSQRNGNRTLVVISAKDHHHSID